MLNPQQERLTANEALCHAYFNTINDKATLQQLLAGPSSYANS